MDRTPEEAQQSLPVASLLEIDKVCRRFEAAWKAGQRPSVDEFLGSTAEPQRSELRRELQTIEAEYRRATGEGLSVEVFAQRLTQSGLMTGEELDTFSKGLSPEKRPATAQQLAQELYRRGKLTKFQAQAVYQGKTRGLVIGNYVVLDSIGRGGMGHVYKARHRRMDRVVALKMLPSRAINSAEAIKRFQREVKAAARLSHPNIVTAHDADEAQGVHFLVMEYVEGNDLASLVKEQGPLDVAAAVDYLTQAAKGLEYAHAEGVIHRDIKPANLLLDKRGTVKLLDMGLARVEDVVGAADNGLTRSGQVMGTLDYMAPEQALDTHLADARSDVYSLGCTLHYLLVGRAPYGGETLTQKILAHREQPVPSLRQVRPDVPEALEAVFQKMLAKEPQERLQSMGEVLAALAACPPPLPRPLTPPPPHPVTPSPPAPETLGLDHYQVSTSSEHVNTGALDEFLIRQVSTPSPPPRPRKPARRRLRARDVKAFVHAVRARIDRRWGIALAVLAGVIFLAAVLQIIIRLQTREGTLIIEINVPGAIVKILDQDGKVEIEEPATKRTLIVSVDPGSHLLRIEKDGFQVFSQAFRIKAGGEQEITATLVPTLRPPHPPTDPKDGWQEFVYDFSQPSQLKDFQVLTGDWQIKDGSLRCTPSAVQGGNCTILLNREFNGELIVEWQQRMSKDPALNLPADNPYICAGVELTPELKPGLSYATTVYAEGGWGPSYGKRVVVLGRYADPRGGTDRAPRSREVVAGDPIGLDQDQSFWMQVHYPGGEERFAVGGMNWRLEDGDPSNLRPRCVWLFCNNCCGQFKSLRIHYRPAGTPQPGPSTPGKPAPPPPPSPEGPKPAAADGQVNLFDGQTLKGWYHIGSGKWTVEDGAIVGRITAGGGHGLLFAGGQFGNFELKLKFKLLSGDSGVFFRIQEGGWAGISGLQANLYLPQMVGQLHWASFDQQNPWRVLVDNPPDPAQHYFKANDWNDLTILADQKRVAIKINETPTAEMADTPGFAQGRIALQVSSNATTEVMFKDISIRSLDGVPIKAGGPLWLGYDLGTERPDATQVAPYSNLLLSACWKGDNQAELDAARKAGMKLLLWVGSKEEMTRFEREGIEFAGRNRDVVLGVISICPTYYRVSPAELAQFATKIKGGLRGIQFWVCLADTAQDTLPYALPDTLDVLAIDCLGCARISDAKSRFETVYPKWLAKANGRPLVLCWDNWQRNGQGLVPTCEAGLFRSIGELAKTQGFAGVTFSTYGPNTFENTTNQGIQTRPELVAEIREIAREWGIERNPSPQAPAPAPPGAASAGWEASVYDFSHASQLTDFKVIAGDWRIEDGCLRCTPKAGEGGNCALLLNRYFEGDLVVEWQQRMSKDPAFTLPADNTDVSAGVELTEELKPGLSYAAVAYADGGWGPRRDHRNRVVVLVRRAREGGGTDRAPGSREVAAGDAIGFDQDQSFRMQVPRADAQKAFTLTGMNWSLENRMAYMLRPRCVWLFCHNCRGEFKNLRIRFLPAVTAGSEPSAATQGKPSGGDAGASQPPPAVAPFDAAKAKEHQQVWAKHLGVPVEVTNSIGMKLALIPPGEFLMGAPDADPLAIAGEKPQHRVRITRAFYMSEYETTQGEFERVMGTNPSGHSPSGRYKDKIAGQQTNRLPVETVSWNESQEFCGKLSEMREEKAAGRVYNLPTEAQCEYACRAGTATRFYFGEVEQLLGDYEWFVGNSGSTPHLVGMKKPNAWGLFDMRGNVWEWCADWYDKDYYGRSPTDDPKGPASGSRRTMRTGHCDAPAVASRSAFRSHVPAGYRSCWGGFRLVCELPRSRAEKAPDPTAPAAASDGGKEVVYDFSQPSQLKDFEVKTGDWRIEDGSLRCTPKAGEAGNCGLLLDRGFDGELEVQWQQRMSKDPGFSLTDENHAVSAGVDLSEGFASEGTWSPDGTMWGLGYVALAYADGGWGPRRDHPNRILLVGRYSRSGGGMEASVESRDLKAGDPIGYDQDQSFRLQLQYPGGQERVTLEGMNWSLENRRVIGLRPRYVSLFCHNCRGQFKNLRIRYRPAQAAATQGKPSGAAVAASPPPAIAPFDAAKAKEHQQAWAKHLGVPVEMTNSIGMKLVLIPPGEFDMGATEQEIERFTNEARQQRMDNALIAGVATNRPQHRVRITKPFYLSAHEVTVGQFASFAQTAGYVTEAEKDGEGGLVFKPDKRDWQKQRGLTWRSPGIDQDATHPVVMVSWNDACAFCAWLRGYRLPTEAEWEYACRAGTTSYWYVGNEERDLRRAANLADETFKQTFPGSATVPWQDGFAFRSPVGRFEPNAFGLYDMHGNVWEWCQDWYDAKYYERSPAEDPTGAASGQSRVIRGGGWILTAFLCRSAGHGDMDKPTERTQYTGFRVVREAGP